MPAGGLVHIETIFGMIVLLDVINYIFILTIIEGVDDTRSRLAYTPVQEFKWSIYLYLLALHGIIAAIVTELMGRSYGKWWLWFIISFCLPLIGPVAILLYHHIVSSSVIEARKRSFWERMLMSAPVSLLKHFHNEQRRAQEVVLLERRQTSSIERNGRDPEIEALIIQGRFSEARTQAWKLLEIAIESHHQSQIDKYQEYLEIIAEKESISSGREVSGA